MSKKSKNPKNPVSDEQVNKKWGGTASRVNRGGCWYGDARYARLSSRNFVDPGYRRRYLGFRIVRNIPKKEKRDE